MLFRHGIAEDAGPTQPDAERPLTSRGKTRTQAAAEGLAKVYDPPRRLLSSPKVRARQTAEIVAKALDCSVETWTPLSAGSAAALQQQLHGFDEPNLMLVGHEPTLSQLAELVCFGETWGRLDLKKAGCAWLEAPIGRQESGGPGQLQALLPPAALVAGSR